MLELFVLAGSIAAVAATLAVDAHQRTAARRALERYAMRRGYRFALGTKRSGPHASGRNGDVEISIDFCRVRGELRTRVCAPTTRGRGPRAAIVQRRSGGASFEEAYRVHGVDPEGAPAMLSGCVEPLQILGRRSAVWLTCNGERASLTWRGIESDIDVMDAAVDAVAAAAAWRAPAAPYR